MEKVIIRNINESYVEGICPESISWELRDYFSFMVPGYQFSPAFRAKRWDGKIKLWDVRTNRIYRGLVPKIETFCQNNGYKFVYEDNYATEFSVKEAEDFIAGLKIPHIPHDFQMNMFVHGIRDKRALFLSPTASGKSLAIYLFIRYLLDISEKKRILIVVPTVGLLTQLKSNFADYGFDSEENVHLIYEGQDKSTNKPVVISTWQSLYTQPKKYFDQFDAVLGDEAHKFKAKSLCHIMESCVHADYRIGLTGTLDGTQTHQWVLEGLFGLVKTVAKSSELMERGILADLEIKCIILKYPDEICKLLKKVEYKDEIKFLVENKERNNFITNLAISLKGNTLVLFNYIEHGKYLFEEIKAKNTTGRKVFLIYGKTDTELREEIRLILNDEKDAILVASYGTTSTGINIPNLSNGIFASPNKARIRILQSIGRILRTTNEKTNAVLFDISDDLRHKTHKNYTLKHFEERMQAYVSEKFKFKIYNVMLKK